MNSMPSFEQREQSLNRRRDFFLIGFVFLSSLAICIGIWIARKSSPVLNPEIRADSPTTPSTPSGTTTATEVPAAASPFSLPAVYDRAYFAPLSPRAANRRVPVIMYHDIVKKRTKKSVYFDCSRDEFLEQMEFLEEKGATVISMEQLHRHLTRGEDVPEGAVVLTFDDNYQGFYDIAYPILREKNYPATVFVHTKFVGDKSGEHPKMDWDTLRLLDKDGLVTIASHTISHPADMAKLPLEKQDTELTESKAILEKELGHSVPFFAYPNGTGDSVTFDAAQRAGYTMAFTIENGPAEQSPSILTVNRYIHTRLEKAWDECTQTAKDAPAAIFEVTRAPVAETVQPSIQLTVAEFAGVKMGIVRGGNPKTVRAPMGVRKSVGEFVQENTSQAGINGTFFTDSNLRGTDNRLIGPSLCAGESEFFAENDAYRLTKLTNRPLVLIGPTRVAVLPFHAGSMNNEQAVRAFMPDVTDVFLAGAWIVHDGVARTEDEMKPYAAADFNDPRRRAFFGFTETGDVIFGGTLEVVSTVKMAEAAAAAGAVEAVLLDSGFSTSVVFDNKIIVTGHTAKNLPSRPVPHGIVVYGTVDAPAVDDKETLEALDKAEVAVGEISAAQAQAEAPKPGDQPRKRRRRSGN